MVLLSTHVQTIIEAMRIRQWIKNGFVFAAPLFARQIAVPDKALAVFAAFAAFCLASSAVYAMNDLIDLRRDRLHPVKRMRPLASGRLTISAAIGMALGLAAAALALSLLMLPLFATMVLIAYILSNLLYSLYLKHLVILDVMFLAVGFILRVLIGAAAAAVSPSHWLLLCTLTVSLFLGFTKRRAELIDLEGRAHSHREVLEHYSHDFLDQMVSISTGATLLCYILYTVDARTAEVFHTRGLIATVPFVLYGVFRYLYLSYHRNDGGNPAELILRDRPFLLNLALWGAACTVIIHYGPQMAAWLPW